MIDELSHIGWFDDCSRTYISIYQMIDDQNIELIFLQCKNNYFWGTMSVIPILQEE
jgi:hypothetical protein